MSALEVPPDPPTSFVVSSQGSFQVRRLVQRPDGVVGRAGLGQGLAHALQRVIGSVIVNGGQVKEHGWCQRAWLVDFGGWIGIIALERSDRQ